MDTLQKEKIVIVEDKIANSIELLIRDEDHTLGNVLTSELLRREDVAFAAYKIPHPLQNIMKLKVSLEHTSKTPVDAVKETLASLKEDCDALLASLSFYRHE
ncbi:DNA-directed RNA polymerase II subunit RPB11 [Nematocida displodere]|uniref:DNA-directed RNA polymerase II subunit RPB11 n=1 Tax=Nematocida displodere TaxID=1805483 RepID=A0A177EIN1_9MICR|nr:DNA-directed RNA polymerase II subunit RPB11 [Nematocida displodere]